MKAWQIEDYGLGHLKSAERAVPKPGAKELLVRVSAVSLNYRDKLILEGRYLLSLTPNQPLIPVSDAAGTVVETGAEVTRFHAGDRVLSHLNTQWIDGDICPVASRALGGPLDGGLAEYMILGEDSAVATPAYLTDEEASTLPIAALTAWFALVEYGRLQKGERVLIQGTGGVSLFGLQIASSLGAHVLVTSSSDEKLEKAKALGASTLINYGKHPKWEEDVLSFTEGKGVDHLLEVVGGEGLNQSLAALKTGGKISLIGILGGAVAPLNLFLVLAKQANIQGIFVGHRRAFERMNQSLEEHRIKPVIDSIYPFREAVEAYRRLDRGPFGKIVIRVAA